VLDALKLIKAPLIELHLSNIHARDELHRHSIMSSVANAVICGLGAEGYPLAVRAVAELLKRDARSG
jgi:3-dehydroquinate dehydratase-2